MKTTEYLFQNITCQMFKKKDFNVLIDGKRFFDILIKNNEETYKQIID